MIQGLYSGAAAMDVLAQQQEMISSNLTHLNTGGHRKSQFAVIQRSNESASDTNLELGPEIEKAEVDFSQGRHQQTGRPLDVAISGDAFFALEGQNGNLYTRAGRFYRDAESSMLVNEEGIPVLGESGPITIDGKIGDSQISIADDGNISSKGKGLGKLQLASFKHNRDLIPVSPSVFKPGPNAEITETRGSVNQFHQEFSNAHPVSELVALIVGSRQYEAVQKAASTISESLREHIRT